MNGYLLFSSGSPTALKLKELPMSKKKKKKHPQQCPICADYLDWEHNQMDCDEAKRRREGRFPLSELTAAQALAALCYALKDGSVYEALDQADTFFNGLEDDKQLHAGLWD
jgi:hypothetical protein